METEEKDQYSKEEVEQKIKEAQQRQLQHDEMRIHGNAFFAEALGHIEGLATRDPFWRGVYQYGKLFEQQFKANTGQIQPTQKQEETPQKD